MQVDHLVLAARTLADGVAWCEAALGITPGPGGEHTFMGTHNRLFSIASAAFPRAYFEIIAINPHAPKPGRARWFDLDDTALQQAVAHGPALIHWVARCDNPNASVAAIRAAGIDRGELLQAERQTPNGLLGWQITVRSDGQRLFGGALPTLIEWADRHPADTMPPSGVALTQLAVHGLPAVLKALLPHEVQAPAGPGAAPLTAMLSTARGPVVLHSLETRIDHVQP